MRRFRVLRRPRGVLSSDLLKTPPGVLRRKSVLRRPDPSPDALPASVSRTPCLRRPTRGRTLRQAPRAVEMKRRRRGGAGPDAHVLLTYPPGRKRGTRYLGNGLELCELMSARHDPPTPSCRALISSHNSKPFPRYRVSRVLVVNKRSAPFTLRMSRRSYYIY